MQEKTDIDSFIDMDIYKGGIWRGHLSEKHWQIIIAASIAAVITLTILMLLNGITTVFMHIYYIPIVLLSYHYRMRGVIFSSLLAFTYFALLILLVPWLTIEIESGFIRVIVFICIALLIASMSETIHRNQIISHKKAEILHSSMMNAQVWLMILDAGGRVHLWNNAATRISGYSAGDVIGKNTIWKKIYPEKSYRNELTSTIERIIFENNFLENFETTVLCKNWERKIISWNTRALPSEVGEEQTFISIGIDVTKSKNAEDALKEVNKKLNLLSSITRHDILNQITVAAGYLEILELDNQIPPDTKAGGYLMKIKGAVDTIKKQILFTGDYKDLGEQAPQWFDVGGLIAEISKNPMFSGLKLHNDIKNIKVFADPLFGKVIYNLFDNAVKHGGKISFISFTARKTNGDIVLICEDDGFGIPDEAKEKIFKREYFKNSGLGLFLSREILAITGLTLTETGKFGEGARFEIHVPEGKFRVSED